MKDDHIYIILTRSNTILSKIIYHFTKEPYTHSGICLDNQLDWFYAFSRRFSYSMWPAGLTKETLYEGVFQRQKNIPCAIYRLDLTREQFEQVNDAIAKMYEHHLRYHYHLLGTIKCKLGIVHKRPKYYFCSQFVAEVIKNANICFLDKDPSLTRPSDLTKIPNATLVFSGTVEDFCKKYNSRKQY